MSLRDKRIYIAGSGGMVGTALANALEVSGYDDVIRPSSGDLDLLQQAAVDDFFATTNPHVVLLAAARVGGIFANDNFRAQFIYENLMIEANVIHSAYKFGVEKLILLGSSCIYPRLSPQPIKEEYLLSGPLEPTNEPYAIAKIAGIKLCESYYRQYGCNFYSVMPTNLYGPYDNFDLHTSHVIPALVRKFSEAKIRNDDKVVLWGTGSARREFMFVDDCAQAIVFLMEKIDAGHLFAEGLSHLNIGTGVDLEIRELASMIASIIGFDGVAEYDSSKPDGMPRKLLDVSRLTELGWKYKTELEEGLKQTIEWYRSNKQPVTSGYSVNRI